MNVNFFDNKSVLIFGAHGQLGENIVKKLIECGTSRIALMDKDEKAIISLKSRLQNTNNAQLRFFLGSLRDKERIRRAFDGIDILLVLRPFSNRDILDYNPMEAVNEFIYSYENIVDTAITQGISYVFSAISADYLEKRDLCSLTKQCAEQILISGNGLSSFKTTKFSLMRIGDILDYPDLELKIALDKKDNGLINTYLDKNEAAYRFGLSIEELTNSILYCMSNCQGGEIFIPESKSYSIYDFIDSFNFKLSYDKNKNKSLQVLSRTGEADTMYKVGQHYLITPNKEEWWNADTFNDFFPTAHKVDKDFAYIASSNKDASKEL